MRATPRRTTNLSTRAFRALLALYPAAFRDEYGRELALVFADRYRDAAGRWDRARLWLEALGGILADAPKEHLRLLGSDVGHALRRLRSNPGFAAVSVGTLTLAIGASTAMFSVLNAVLLRPLPFPSPEQLVAVWTEIPSQGLREGRSAYWNVEQWRRESGSFADLAVFDPVSLMFARAGESDQISASRISPNYLSMLGVQPALGRTFTAREADERQRVAVISHRFWQARFGGARDALGAVIVLDGQASHIVGILPAGLKFPGLDADVLEPHTLFPDWSARRSAFGAGSWFVMGRLHPGVTVDQAQAEMAAIARRLDAQLPAAEQHRGVNVVPLSRQMTGPAARLALWLATGAAVCVLLIATANVAGLSLARSVGRAPEMAIRAALGASRARLVRQLLAESVTLAVISGALGMFLAIVGTDLIRRAVPGDLARVHEVSVDLRVLGWALMMSLLTGVLVGLAPAATVWREDLRASSDEGGRGVSGAAAPRRLRRALVVAECAAALMLLVSAGLLIRSWWHVIHVDPGFRTERVLSLGISTPPSIPAAERAHLYDRLLERATAFPGVESAGIGSELFTSGVTEQTITADGGDQGAGERVRFRSDEVSAGFFAALGTPLLRGRFFGADDGPTTGRVAIVNDAMANRLWPGRDPVGRRFTIGPGGAGSSWLTVVGVVGDMRRQGLETEATPQIFEALAQNPSRRAILFVRTSVADPLQMADSLRAALRQVDPLAPVYGATTLDERLGALLAQRRFQTSLLIGFAAVALLLAAIGIYGLIQYSVATRTQEIGVRMALGAKAGDIFRMVIGEGLTLGLSGLALGLLGAGWLGQAGSSLHVGVTATDPATFVAVSLLLAAVVTAACWLPARRAMKVEPIAALRRTLG
jgi:putative ABC transport system permease protein